MKAAAFDYIRATDAADAVRALAAAGPNAKALAGGQSLGPMLNLRLARPSALVDIRRCPDLAGVTESADAITYGAAIPHAAFEDQRVPDATPGWLQGVARGIAYRAVRNKGTIGGSVVHADPAADWPTVLLALGAEVLTLGPAGAQTLPLQSFLKGPFAVALASDEILTGLRLSKRGTAARWGYWKFCRKTGEFAKASAAVLHDPDRGETRAVIGAVEQAPILVPDAAELLANPMAAAEIVNRLAPNRSPAARQLHAQALERAAWIALGRKEIAA